MCNVCLIKFFFLANLFPSYTIAVFLAVLIRPKLYTVSSAAPDIRQLLLLLSTHLHISRVRRQDIYPLHGTSSAIEAPSKISYLYRIFASLSRGPRWSSLLDLNIASDILTLTKPHNSEYSRFRLKLSSAANLFYAVKIPLKEVFPHIRP